MPVVTVVEGRCRIKGSGYENSTWVKRNVSLLFDENGIADASKADADTLDLHLHPEFSIGETFDHTFKVELDDLADLDLKPGQRVGS